MSCQSTGGGGAIGSLRTWPKSKQTVKFNSVSSVRRVREEKEDDKAIVLTNTEETIRAVCLAELRRRPPNGVFAKCTPHHHSAQHGLTHLGCLANGAARAGFFSRMPYATRPRMSLSWFVRDVIFHRAGFGGHAAPHLAFVRGVLRVPKMDMCCTHLGGSPALWTTPLCGIDASRSAVRHHVKCEM